jgi:hypothetical protein
MKKDERDRGNVARVLDKRNACRVLFGNPKGKRLLGGHRNR